MNLVPHHPIDATAKDALLLALVNAYPFVHGALYALMEKSRALYRSIYIFIAGTETLEKILHVIHCSPSELRYLKKGEEEMGGWQIKNKHDKCRHIYYE